MEREINREATKELTKEETKEEKEERKESLDAKEEDPKGGEFTEPGKIEEDKASKKEEKREFEDEAQLHDKKKLLPFELADEKMLKEFPYYHGYLPREDVSNILKHDGDFLLRITEVDTGAKGKQLVISCMAFLTPTERESIRGSVRPDQLKLRHFVINRQMDRQFRIDEKFAFSTVKDLIKHCIEIGHTTKQGHIRLKKGIGLFHWEYTYQELQLGKILGSGQYGEVREGVLTKKKNKNKVNVAVKLGKDQGLVAEKCKEKVKEFMKEARIMKFLRHKNVVHLYGVLVLEQPIGIILELVDGGALDSYLRKFESLIDAKEKVQMCCGAAAGLAYLHSQKIIHRDIAARNCLYNTEKIVKISDFGLSKAMEHVDMDYKLMSGKKFPIKWLAPETINEKMFSSRTDVYSFGVLVWEIFSDGKDPYSDEKNAEVKARVINGKFLEFPPDTPLNLVDFISTKVFVLDRNKRLPMGDVARFLENILTESKMRAVQEHLTLKTEATLRTSRETVDDGSLYGGSRLSNSSSREKSSHSGAKAKAVLTNEITSTPKTPDKKTAKKKKSGRAKKSALHKAKFHKAK